jgi:stage III sporulation protein AD
MIFKVVGIAMTCVVLYLFLEKQNKDIAVLVSLAACCAVTVLAISYLDEVLDFIWDLTRIGQLNNSFLKVLLKSVGIGLIGEISTLVCNDAGNSALGKTIQIVSVCIILWTAIPLLSELMNLINQILGEA